MTLNKTIGPNLGLVIFNRPGVAGTVLHCSYLPATYLLAKLGYNGLISSKTSGVYFKTITFMLK